MIKGRIVDGILEKSGKKVVKFWKHDGYGIKSEDLKGVNGVILDTQYDGKLYTSVDNLFENGIRHQFNDERQIILPVKYWRPIK